MRRTAQAGLLTLLTAAAPACTYTKATYHLADAELTIVRARQYGAGEHSVYEMTMAQRYLDKAREEAGYAEYKTAWELALTASEWADAAVISMEERGIRGNVEASTGGSDMKGPASALPKPGPAGSTAPPAPYTPPKPGTGR